MAFGKGDGDDFQSKVKTKLPAPPSLDGVAAMEELLQGGWTSEVGHKYRYLTREERDERPEESSITVSDLSDDQLSAYHDLFNWFNDVRGESALMTLGGYAGTGKSTVISVFARNHRSDRIAYCAYTGKAANVLKQKLRQAGVGRTAFVGTIHSLIYQPIWVQGAPVAWKKLEFLDYDLIVVDEASMVNEEILKDLASFNIPILAVGDHGQLAPIEGKFNLMENPNLRLEQVHRQAEGNPIISLATFIREEGELPMKYTANANVRFVHPNNARDAIGALYTRDMSNTDLSDSAILCYTNAKRRMANALVRDLRWGVKDDDPPQSGDLLICLRNYFTVFFNGMRARLLSIQEHGEYWYWNHVMFDEDGIELKAAMFRPQFNRNSTIIQYEDVEKYRFDRHGWGKQIGLLFDFGYAMTVHKAQGSAFKDVFLLYERPNLVDRDDFRRWLYTAVTRSSERLSVVVR